MPPVEYPVHGPPWHNHPGDRAMDVRGASMYNPMSPCPGCSRHVRVDELVCPFCRAGLSPAFARRLAPDTTQRLSRAAMFAVGATLAAAGCSATLGPTGTGSGDATVTDVATDNAAVTDVATDNTAVTDDALFAHDGPVFTHYGSPPRPDAATDAPGDAATDTAGDVPEDHGNIAPPYGFPPQDAGPPDDVGGGSADYGGPPFPRDAATPDCAASVALYGGPPPRCPDS
jgi:hypothetical protein